MEKIRLGPTILAYPMPAFLLGSFICCKPNFMTAAWGGIACGQPPMISISIHHKRYTLQGIKQTGEFSVCIPSQEQVTETDFCGIVSGKRYNKITVCGFDIFYGDLANAPMIVQCPVTLECQVEQIPDLGSHVLVIGKITETHVNQNCLTEGKPDVEKIRPFIYSTGCRREYIGFGNPIAQAFQKGKDLKPG